MLSIEFDWDDKLTSFESIPLIYLRTFIRVHLYLPFTHRGLFQRRERNKRKRSGLFLFSYLLVPICQGTYTLYLVSSPGFLFGGVVIKIGSVL